MEEKDLCECGPCHDCVFWEKQSGQWGRCWAPESGGEEYGLIIAGNGFLRTREDFCCSAFLENDEDDENPDMQYSDDDE